MRIYKIAPQTERLRWELERIGVDGYALGMDKKGICLNLSIRKVKPPAANIIKQEAIASGMDAAVKRGSVSCSVDFTDVLLMGSVNAYGRLIKRLKIQPFGLKEISEQLEKAVKNEMGHEKYFMAKGIKISLDTPKIMGILNVTPDSFSDGGNFLDNEAAALRVDDMLKTGADIIDIGGMSSRPSADYISVDEEIKRIDYSLKYACGKGALVSVDTCNPETASFALKNGAAIINDISGLSSQEMKDICSEHNAGVCIMHMLGDPKNMQDAPQYNDIFCDIKDFFADVIKSAEQAGIDKRSIIIDVGFGFGKTVVQNYLLLKYLNEFSSFGMPILAGISRKSMIGAVTGQNACERITGTVALNTAALLAGASIIRVHDVVEACETVKVIDYLKKAEEK